MYKSICISIFTFSAQHSLHNYFAWSRYIHNPATEILVIEVWDSDEETVGGIKGVKGLVQ